MLNSSNPDQTLVKEQSGQDLHCLHTTICLRYIWLSRSLPTFGPRYEKMTLLHANKGADLPAHWRSLISTFVIHYLESIVVKLASCNISKF